MEECRPYTDYPTENKEVKKKYTEATRQINTLAQEKKNLNEKVTLAAQLDATNFVTYGRGN